MEHSGNRFGIGRTSNDFQSAGTFPSRKELLGVREFFEDPSWDLVRASCFDGFQLPEPSQPRPLVSCIATEGSHDFRLG